MITWLGSVVGCDYVDGSVVGHVVMAGSVVGSVVERYYMVGSMVRFRGWVWLSGWLHGWVWFSMPLSIFYVYQLSQSEVLCRMLKLRKGSSPKAPLGFCTQSCTGPHSPRESCLAPFSSWAFFINRTIALSIVEISERHKNSKSLALWPTPAIVLLGTKTEEKIPKHLSPDAKCYRTGVKFSFSSLTPHCLFSKNSETSAF